MCFFQSSTSINGTPFITISNSTHEKIETKFKGITFANPSLNYSNYSLTNLFEYKSMQRSTNSSLFLSVSLMLSPFSFKFMVFILLFESIFI